MGNPLEFEISRYNTWKEDLVAAVSEYRDWLEATKQLDAQQSTRFYDLIEDLKHGRLMLAFIAEFSRGKTELINSLFFAEYGQRLLPSDVGRTTMCPTEIFYDPNIEPCIRLLPIESRYRIESIAQLKTMPVEWSTIRLNISSGDDMAQAMKSLAEFKSVQVMEAKMMGMVDDEKSLPPGTGPKDKIEIPAWRYAMVNYPHPLLSRGLTILDTPGLNALGLEPELTLATLPGAHAAFFLLGVDTGVTRSDMELWQRYVKDAVALRIAVLNKIDLTWDELKPWDEIRRSIERQRESTAKLLDLPKERVLTVSAQKALLGKIRNDQELLEKSGILKMESVLAHDIIPAKREIMRAAVMNEVGAMMIVSQSSIEAKIQGNIQAITELSAISGKSKDLIAKLWRKINQDKEDYNAALTGYKTIRNAFNTKRLSLMERLNPDKIDEFLNRSRDELQGSWTTMGLHQSMTKVFDAINPEFDRIQKMAEDMHTVMKRAYLTFEQKFHFPAIELPVLNLESYRVGLQLLAKETEAFCKDPVNVMLEKRFLIRKFYDSLMMEARQIFVRAGDECDRWMRGVTTPLENQLRDHKAQLQQRLDSLTKINQDSGSIQERLVSLKEELVDLQRQKEMISRLLAKIKDARPEATAA
jgi:hypothetical protein